MARASDGRRATEGAGQQWHGLSAMTWLLGLFRRYRPGPCGPFFRPWLAHILWPALVAMLGPLYHY